MKIRRRVKLSPVNLFPGDTVVLSYKRINGKTGAILSEQRLVEEKIERRMTADEAIVFDVDEAMAKELGIVDGIGGLLIQSKKLGD